MAGRPMSGARPDPYTTPIGGPDHVRHPRADNRPIGGRRGLPSWAAGALAVGLSVVAGVVDEQINHTVGVPFGVGYVLGCVGAVLMVRPRGLFVPAAAPPLIMVLAVTIAAMTAPGHGTLTALALAIGTQVLFVFPLMAVVTGVTLVVGAVRELARRRLRLSTTSGL